MTLEIYGGLKFKLKRKGNGNVDTRDKNGNGIVDPNESGNIPFLLSATDNGDGTTTVTGRGFGVRSQAAPVLYDRVSEAYENGNYNDFNSTFFVDNQNMHEGNTEVNRIYDGVSTPLGEPGAHPSIDRDPCQYRTLSNNFRHPNMSAYYQIRRGSFLGLPIAYGGRHDNNPGDVRYDRPDGEKQLYVAWWIWRNVQPVDFYIFSVASVSGDTFQTGDEYRRGERIILHSAGNLGKDVIGWVHRFDSANNYLFFEVDTDVDESIYSRPNNTAADGSSFTAQTSGTTGTFVSDDSFWRPTSPHKYARFWESGGGSSGLRATLGVNDFLSISDKNTGQDLGVTLDASLYGDPLSWSLFEVLIDKGEVNPSNFRYARAEVRVNGKLQGSKYDINPAIIEQETSSPTMHLIGQNTPKPLPGLENFAGLDFRISEVIQDKTWQRIVIADSDDLVNATHYEIQRPITWSDNEITFEKTEGTLSGQLYAFVFNANGLSNETGIAL